MGKFTNKLTLTQINKNLWEVDEPFQYHVDNNEVIWIPKGYLTDGATIPRFLWTIIGHPLQGYAQAAVIHDFCYGKRLYSRKRSDEIFLEAMAVLEVPRWKRRVIFRALRLFGWWAWGKRNPAKK